MAYSSLCQVTLCVLVAVFVGCSSPNMALMEAKREYADADFFQAWQSIQEAKANDPDSPEVQEAYEKIRIAYLLKEGQQKIFLNREVEALESLEKVLVLEPEHAIAERLITRARRKLALEAAIKGDTLRGEGDLEGALVKYHEALQQYPGLQLAEAGLEAVAETWRQRRKSARDHYLEGVRALAERLFLQTEYHMLLALEKDPTMDEAKDPARLASRRLAELRFASAKEMEEGGFWSPALREYEALVADFPDFDGIEDRIAAVRDEVRAEELATKGSSAAFRGEFRDARQFLEEAMQLTQRQRDEIVETLTFVHEREIDQRYTLAKDEELQGRLEGALAAYQVIDGEAPGFRDVRARISDLEIRIEEAKRAYAAGVTAQDAGDNSSAIDSFTDVLLYWPDYLDAKQRLKALRDIDS